MITIGKKDKKELLINSAIKLFKEKGIKHTKISDITEDAGVAKGTFYTYFKDKNEILNIVIKSETQRIINDAIINSKNLNDTRESKRIIFIANSLIDEFESKKNYVDVIHKNLYRGLFTKDEGGNSIFSKYVNEFLNNSDIENKDELGKKLYLIVELIGGVAYNSIYNKMPYEITDIKEMLFKSIEKIYEI